MTRIGREVGGRYRLIELLGEGGMATIYRAHDSELDRDVAVKILRPEYGGDPDFGARFRHEAQAAASLSHPNIVSVFDYGSDEAGPYIVMEYVDGEDLASLLRRNGPLSPRRAARLTADIARALAAAHARGIVHRDVKPGNVLLSRDGRVKVADFGIARAFAEAQLTLPGTTLGSVHYFSPEQARGDPTTAASDIYSLGIVLYELLVGRRPWEGDSAASIALARLTGPAPMVSSVRSGLPPVLEAIDRKAMAPDPDDRFPSADAMAGALEDFLADRGVEPGLDPSVGAAAAAGAAAAGAAGSAASRIADRGDPGARGGQVEPHHPVPAAAAAPGTAGAAAAGVARANPNVRPPYPADAYAGPGDGRRADAAAPRRPTPAERSEGGGSGAWAWLAGLLGLLILAGAAFLLVNYLNRPAAAPPVVQVVVPDFRGRTVADAQALARQKDLQVSLQGTVPASGDQADGTIASQDPPPNSHVDSGSTVNVTIFSGRALVQVPPLTGLTEQVAITRLVQANLAPGARTTVPDPSIPAGSIVSQNPRANTPVAAGTTVDYSVSSGPSPSPSPSPTPSPTPEITPTPPPTAPPETPPPTPPPSTPPPNETPAPSPSV